MSGTNTPTQIPIEVTTGSSAQQVEALTKRVQALKSALGNLVPVFNALGEDGPKALRNLLSQMSALNQVASTTSVMAGQLNAVASGAARNRRAANEYVVQQAATRRSVPAAIRSNDPNQISAVMEVLRREIDNLRLREAQLIRRRADNAEAGRPVTQIQRSLDALPRRLAEAEEKLQRLAAAAAALAEQQRVQAGVQSRIRGIAIGEAFAQTPEGRQQRLDRFNATFSRFLSGQAAREQAATESTLVGIRRNSLLGAARASAQERREAARQEERDEAAYQRLRTRSIVAAAIAGARERREAAQQEEREERNIAGIRRRTLQQQAARNGALNAATERGRTAAEAQAALYADPSMRGLLAQNQATRTMLGVEAFNSLARTPEFARLLAERSFMSGMANQQSRLQLNADPTYQRNQVQLGLQGINTRLSIREAEMANPEFQARDRNITNARSLDRLFGDGGGTLLTVQAGLLANYTVLNQLFSALTNTTQAVVEFDNALKNLQAISASSNGEMEKLRGTVIEVSRGTRFSAVELTEAATLLAQAGLGVSEINRSLQGVALLATATGSDLRTSVDITTTALSVFRQRADEVPRIADQMTAALNLSKLTIDQVALGFQYVGNTAAEAGLSFTEVTTALATLANQGIRSGSTIGTGLRQLIVDLQTPNERLAQRFRELGVTMADVDLRANGLEGVLENLRRAGFTSADAFATIELRAAAVFSAFQRGAADMSDLQGAIQNSSGAAQANATQMESLRNRFLQLVNSLNAVVFTMSDGLVKVLGTSVSAFNALVGAVAPATDALTAFGNVLSALAVGAVVAFVGRLATSFGVAVSGILGATAAANGFALALRAIPFVGVLASIGTLLALFANAQSEAQRAAAEMDRLKQSANETKAAFDSAREGLRGLEEFMQTTIARSRVLNTDQAALNRTVDEARSRFGALSSAVYQNIDSYNSLIGVLRTVRREMAQTMLIQAQSASMAAEARYASTQAAFDQGGNGGEAERVLRDLGLGRDVTRAVERRTGNLSREDFGRLSGPITVEEILRGLGESGSDPRLRRALEIVGGVGGRPDANELGTLLNAFPQEPGSEIAGGLSLDRSRVIREALERQRRLLGENVEARANLTLTRRRLGESQFGVSPEFQSLADLADQIRRNNADAGSVGSGRSLAERQSARDALEGRNAPLFDLIQQGIEALRPEQQAMLEQNGFNQVLGELRRNMDAVRRGIAETGVEVARTTGQAVSAEAQATLRRIRSEPTRDQEVARAQLREIEQVADRVRNAETQVLNAELEQLTREGKTTEQVEGVRRARLTQIQETYQATVQQGQDAVTQGVTREIEARLREITQSLRTGLSRRPGTRGQARGTAEGNEALQNEALRLIRQRGETRGDSNATIESDLEAFRQQFSRVGVNGGSAPEGTFIPNARVTIQQQLRNAQSELDTNLRGSRTAIEARRAQLDAARRMPTLFPQSYTNELDREINQMEVEFERNAISAREGYLQALDGIFQRARQALDDLKRLLEGSSGAERQRIEQRIEEAQGTLESVTQARERARGDVERSRAVIAARQPGQQFTAMDGFESAGRDFQQRMGLNDSAFKFTADSMTTLFNGMQQASANFFDTLVTGSAKSSDAFKQFGVSILRTVQQIATQRLAAQLIGMAINFAFGAAGGTGTTGAVDVSSSTAASNGMMGFGRWGGYEGGLVTSRGIMRFAGGGMVPGTHVGRDTVPSLLAPGEAVLNRRAVSLVGTDAVQRMNQGMVQADQAIQPLAIRREPDNVSVYVMAPNEKPSLGPKDVLAVIGQDVLTGGSTKQLIRQVAVGAL